MVNLDATNKMIATSFDQTVWQTIGTVQVPNAGIGVRGGLVRREVYDNETAVSDTTQTELQAVPNETTASGGWVNEAAAAASHISIDEGATVNVADYVRRQGALGAYIHRYNTATLSLAGKRIVAIRFNAYMAMGPNSSFSAWYNIGGTIYPAHVQINGPFKPVGQPDQLLQPGDEAAVDDRRHPGVRLYRRGRVVGCHQRRLDRGRCVRHGVLGQHGHREPHRGWRAR